MFLTKNGRRKRDFRSFHSVIRKARIAACWILPSIILAWFFFRSCFFVLEISGVSMLPTLQARSFYLFKRAWLDELDRGDIVVFKLGHSNSMLVKRLIATSGDLVEIRNGTLLVNGQEIKEEYLLECDDRTKLGPTKIPPDRVFVLADNRFFSTDSRDWGPIETADIKGALLLRVWPISW